MCDDPLARNLVLLTAAVAAAALLRYVDRGLQTNGSITLSDLATAPLEPPE